MNNKKLLKILFAAVIVVVAGVVFSLVNSAGSASESVLELSRDSEETSALEEEQRSEESEAEMLCVHVCGAVNSPGVYYLEAGSRVHEAVELAGGLSDDAAQEYVNLASALEDGQQLYIPTLEEAEEQGLSAGVEDTSGDSASDGLVNINTADAEELQTLPGIGETKAQAIITYRENNGSFSSISEIVNVSGIGESTYEQLKDYIKV